MLFQVSVSKLRIHNITAKAALKFVSEVWVPKKRGEQRLEAAQMKFLRQGLSTLPHTSDQILNNHSKLPTSMTHSFLPVTSTLVSVMLNSQAGHFSDTSEQNFTRLCENQKMAVVYPVIF